MIENKTASHLWTNPVNQIVSISDMKISNRKEDVLITYSLGSCIGVTFFDPVAHVGGLVHCMLPLSRVDPEKAKQKPCMFADTGLQMVLKAIFELGAKRRNIIVKAAGAATLMDRKGLFRIGERNYAMLRKVLWKNNILITTEDIGGIKTRTMTLYMDSGITTIKSRGREVEL